MTTQFKKSKVIMLSTEKASKIGKNRNTNHLYYFDPVVAHEGQYLCFLSDEEIKGDNWCYNIKDNSIFQAIWILKAPENFRKIIASTDPSLNLPRPSDSFIKKYCELGGIENVMVEYEEFVSQVDQLCYLRLKVAPDNSITIKGVKNMWNREEVIELMRKAWNAKDIQYQQNHIVSEHIHFMKWIETNL